MHIQMLRRYSRRMAYPHAITRVKHHQFFSKGWKRAVPIMLSTIVLLLIGTLVFLRLVGYYRREYELRRSSRLMDGEKFGF
ncbi:hypothetical protein DICVIV_10308 [Dictyocaulus viviparus]|uniref:Uncharacterized protein n=1 Tax=Dictyocaulus viviparus TaxID=29172 RepID=A0A0D8XIU5_DICVI|nr:hypothetical protein DICVIV_10308 [Dictyocaulus viviparus]